MIMAVFWVCAFASCGEDKWRETAVESCLTEMEQKATPRCGRGPPDFDRCEALNDSVVLWYDVAWWDCRRIASECFTSVEWTVEEICGPNPLFCLLGCP